MDGNRRFHGLGGTGTQNLAKGWEKSSRGRPEGLRAPARAIRPAGPRPVPRPRPGTRRRAGRAGGEGRRPFFLRRGQGRGRQETDSSPARGRRLSAGPGRAPSAPARAQGAPAGTARLTRSELEAAVAAAAPQRALALLQDVVVLGLEELHAGPARRGRRRPAGGAQGVLVCATA